MSFTPCSLPFFLLQCYVQQPLHQLRLRSDSAQAYRHVELFQSASVMKHTNSGVGSLTVSGVRRVVHWDAPNSLEGYSQESGRAGRDGLPCKAIMYTSRKHLNQVCPGLMHARGSIRDQMSHMWPFSCEPP